MKKFLLAVLAALNVLLSGQVFACYDPSRPKVDLFIERVGPVLDLKEVDRLHGFFVKFTGSLDQLNWLVSEGRPRGNGNAGRQIVFRSLAQAQAAADPNTTHIIGVGNDGEVESVWTVKGVALIRYKTKSGCSGWDYN